MAHSFGIEWSVDLNDTCAMPLSDIQDMMVMGSRFGSYFVLELTQESFSTILKNYQYLGRVYNSRVDKDVHKLTDVLYIDHVCIGDEDRLYVFGGKM